MIFSSPPARSLWPPLLAVAACIAPLTGCSTVSESLIPPAVISLTPTLVQVPTLPNEDLIGPCEFLLQLPSPNVPQAGTVVVYDREDDSDVYNSPQLQQSAATLHFAMVFAYQCNSKSHQDLQPNAFDGQGRVLLAAMNQFAINVNHPELATTNFILFGFSAAAILTQTMESYAPNRILGGIEYAPGDPWLNTVPVTAQSAKTPTLILTNAADHLAGNWNQLQYFLAGRAQGAPWAFAVQNGTSHCCAWSTVPIIIPWIQAIAAAPPSAIPTTSAATQALFPTPTFAAFQCKPDGVWDANGTQDCAITQASFSAAQLTSGSQSSTGWLPNQAAATAWLNWVESPGINP
jgi:hypothetical protein